MNLCTIQYTLKNWNKVHVHKNNAAHMYIYKQDLIFVSKVRSLVFIWSFPVSTHVPQTKQS